jgi:ABC-type branched-subunit amino acid transport system substrate-binding protein
MSDQLTTEASNKPGFFFSSTGLKSFAAVAALILVLSWVRASPQKNQAGSIQTGLPAGTTEEVQAGQGAGAGATEAGKTTSLGSAAQSGSSTTSSKTTSKAGLECKAGRNGGVTDKGVTATRIKLATTAVLDGPAKSLLSDSAIAMKALIDKTNRAGGVCGRLLALNVVNDSFIASTGLQYIKNFIAEGYFALPVMPSAEGLGAAILSGDISTAQIPVVGTDGMRKEQYGNPFVWPVAAATVTSMRVMAKYGYTNRNARTFAIVYDSKYKFGVEGKDAFIDQVAKMGGCAPPAGKGPEDSPCMVTIQPLDPEQNSYSSEAQAFNTKCQAGAQDQSKCDMVAMLLLPDTAKNWLQRLPVRARLYTSGAQTLFTDRFAQDCVQQAAERCQDFAVWTGYNPPIGPMASLPGVAAYVSDVQTVKPTIDVNNQFIEGAYLGMSVFIEALRKVGPDLTRANLIAAMDSLDYKNDFTSTLSWRAGKHSANIRAQSFAMTVTGGTFRGWRNEATGFVLDPAFGG